jgi:membrane protease YdiL (CAAX protease family)
MKSLTTIEEFDKPYQAQVSVFALEQAGIQCFLENETIVAMDWFMANAVGGIKLQVANADSERAVQILREVREAQNDRESANKDKWVAFLCTGCKKPIAFSGTSFGRVENCPECGKFVDVPQHSDSTFSPDMIEQTILKANEAKKIFSGSLSKRTFLLCELLLVLYLAYFRDLYSAIQSFLQSVETGWLQEESGFAGLSEGELGWLASRSLFVIACMLPILFLNGLNRQRKVENRFGWCRSLGVGVVLGAITFAISFVLARSQTDAASEIVAAQQWPLAGASWPAFLIFAFFANSVAEELVMRAYLIDRLEKLVGKTWFAVVVSSLMFGSYHVYLGVINGLVSATLTGLVFGSYYAWNRKLLPIVVAHTIQNILCVFVFH